MTDVTHGKLVYKDSNNNAGTIIGLSENDINKMNAKATLDVASSASASISNKHGELYPATDRLTAPDTHYPVIIQAHFITGDIKQTMNPNFDATEWVLGNGALVPRTGAYKDLWEFANDLGLVRDASAQASYESDPSAFEGVSYGPGDGSTTFQLPDFRGRVIQGVDASHALGHFIKAGLPDITGYFGTGHEYYGSLMYYNGDVPNSDTSSGAFRANIASHSPMLRAMDVSTQSTMALFGQFFNASRSSSYYSATSKPQVDGLAVYSLIKL